MKSPMMNGWTKKTVSPGGATVECPDGEDVWVETTRQFLDGSLSNVHTVDSAETSEVFQITLDTPPGSFYLKRYRDRDTLDPWKNIVRASRGRRAVQNDLQCQQLGFNVAQPLCLVEQRKGLRLVDCMVISEAIEDAPILRDWLTLPELGRAHNRREKQKLLHELAIEVARWHEAGLHHGDLRAGNLLIRQSNDGYSFYWLDNERTQRFSSLPLRSRIHNLSRLNLEPCGVDQADRLRFWKTYCEMSNLNTSEQKQVLTHVLAITLRRRKKRGWA